MEYQVKSVSLESNNERNIWLINFIVDPTNKNPGSHSYAIPRETLLWRAVEYGINAEDSRTLLDVILHEQWMTDNHPGNPTHMVNVDKQVAWAAHQVRLAMVKNQYTVTDPNNVLRVIHDSHVVDYGFMKRAHLEVNRARAIRVTQLSLTSSQN